MRFGGTTGSSDGTASPRHSREHSYTRAHLVCWTPPKEVCLPHIKHRMHSTVGLTTSLNKMLISLLTPSSATKSSGFVQQSHSSPDQVGTLAYGPSPNSSQHFPSPQIAPP